MTKHYKNPYPVHGGLTQRFNWRVKERVGPRFWLMRDKQWDQQARMVSWRRAL